VRGGTGGTQRALRPRWLNEHPVHPGLAWLRATPDGRDWLERLPSLVEESAAAWSLTLSEPFAYAFASLAIPATCADGTQAVLKVQFPDREGEHEAAALEHWNGDGAVRLLAHDPGHRALLLERCVPGTSLARIDPDVALDVAIDLLPRLWVPAAAPFRSLAAEAASWSAEMSEQWHRREEPFERRLLDASLDALAGLPATQGPQVLLHQDLHADNVLRAEREPWLVIDPKPVTGEREFGLAALVRGDELGRGPEAMRHRLDRLTAALGLDRERARAWAMAQTLAWSFGGDGPDASGVETARWLLELR
jgi:streptomycin 6-kinase